MAGRSPERNLRDTFTDFYNNWHIKHEKYLDKLLVCVENNIECKEMVAETLGHYQYFFQEKSKVANEDIFLVMSSPWFTSFETSISWISGFKPSILFSLIKNSVGEELSSEQQEKIEVIKAEIRKVEKDIDEELARVQESVAGQRVFPLLRRFDRLVDGEISELDVVLEDLKNGMIVVVEEADILRRSTMKKLMDVLNPIQNLKFLIASAQFVDQTRKWGVYKDSLIPTTTGSTTVSAAGTTTSSFNYHP